MGDSAMRGLVLFGIALVAITEGLGAIDAIGRGPLAICWAGVLAGMVFAAWKRRDGFRWRLTRDPLVLIAAGGTLAVLALTGVTAAFSAPNSADALAYHLPRVVYWAEQGSVRFFPTPYFNQIMLQPFAEYAMLHLYVLSGGDRLTNLVQWFASVGSLAAVAGVARLLGSGRRGQAVAALFCATIPAGILASSGAKNDYWMAMWMMAAIYFALSYAASLRVGEALAMGAALGLALLTKATAYLFAPWLLAAVLVARGRREKWRRLAVGGLVALSVSVAINLPQYARNYGLSGSPMGFDSAQGDGVFRWRNAGMGWKATVSNVLRNGSEQLGARSQSWNEGVFRLVVGAHRWMGMDPDDPATTWHGAVFTPPRNANHEANAPNRWQVAILLVVAVALGARGRRERGRLVYLAALVCGFLAFCAYLKWQPFSARLVLPLFVASAPLVGVIGEWRRWFAAAICLFLIGNARLPALENWVRPLRGPRSVLDTPRDRQYFADMTQWNNEAAYRQTVDLLAKSQCGVVGIDIADLQLEYPLQALLRERRPEVRFAHTGVQNVSARYAAPVAGRPCAVACLGCAGDAKRLALYSGREPGIRADTFVIFLR